MTPTKNTTLDDIAAVIGFSATIRLAAWFGGGNNNNTYVPAAVEEGDLLAKVIGLSAARRLAAEWPKTHLTIPTLAQYDRDVRNRLVATLLEVGMKEREIAKFTGLGERRVQQIARELEQAGLIEIVLPNSPQEKVG